MALYILFGGLSVDLDFLFCFQFVLTFLSLTFVLVDAELTSAVFGLYIEFLDFLPYS